MSLLNGLHEKNHVVYTNNNFFSVRLLIELASMEKPYIMSNELATLCHEQ